MIMGLCHVGEMKWAMKFMVRMKDDGCNVQS
jgi:pentatricopeptide repeat protein